MGIGKNWEWAEKIVFRAGLLEGKKEGGSESPPGGAESEPN